MKPAGVGAVGHLALGVLEDLFVTLVAYPQVTAAVKGKAEGLDQGAAGEYGVGGGGGGPAVRRRSPSFLSLDAPIGNGRTSKSA